MRLNPAHFNRHLNNIGQKLKWRRSYACACVNPASGQPDPKHSVCHGKGRIWDAGVTTVGGVAKQVVKPQMAGLGIWESGDMQLTVPESSPMWADAGKYDRVLLLNSTDVFSLPLVRGGVNEKVIFTVQSVSRCFYLHPTTKAIVDCDLPTVGADGVPVWVSGANEPPPNAAYSLTGQKYDEYFVIDSMPSDRNEHQGARLPKLLQLRKWDLFGR